MKKLLPLLIACLLLGAQMGCKSDTPPPDTGGGGGGGSHQPLQGVDGDGGGGGDNSGCVDGSTTCSGNSATTASGPNQAGGWIAADHRSVQAISADSNGNVTFPCNGTWCPINCTNGTMTVQVDPNQTGVWQD
ncbi:MAG TPA: hypothetical protein VJ866_11140 [Pyrinomonadaceae bacterium]|nr:hypothetical protein [Pyrinomonadaceae bacterium]